ncbi:hypothetical protein PMAYCL1PPCAC_28837, partial [Pristionchus mayeri]
KRAYEEQEEHRRISLDVVRDVEGEDKSELGVDGTTKKESEFHRGLNETEKTNVERFTKLEAVSCVSDSVEEHRRDSEQTKSGKNRGKGNTKQSEK